MNVIKFTEDVLKKAEILLSNGNTVKDTAKQLDVSPDKLSRLLRNRGVVIAKPGQRTDIPVDLVIKEYLAGESSTMLAEKYSSGHGTIRRILNLHGIEMRSGMETKRMKACANGKLIYRKHADIYENPECIPADILSLLSPKIRSWFGYSAA